MAGQPPVPSCHTLTSSCSLTFISQKKDTEQRDKGHMCSAGVPDKVPHLMGVGKTWKDNVPLAPKGTLSIGLASMVAICVWRLS